ncbi:hypothetical protein [Sphingomonas prati]|uniref:Uncharacterized protein n=1 Tax=Sphingomonas prati TaxID=1843237 RepID=A0A7W9F2G4_9SPHN|nr:hypothetical protein [Sphingomonas prati]MBB5728465.1 hypothetical protein [Sphingomonas prati]GGE73568.1 hypothetical protein GCM10011404_02620 [Sphingomonas prati]
MFDLIGSMLLLAAPALPSNGSAPAPVTSPLPDKARSAVIGCGVAPDRVSVSYDEDMQEDVVWIASGKPPFAKTMLSCIARASRRTSYYVYFREAAEWKRYSAIYATIANTGDVAEARGWLQQQNRLETAPSIKRGRPLAGFTKAVEQFCGVRPGALLVAVDDRTITFTKGGLGHLTATGVEGAAATPAQYECVTYVMAASDLLSHDIFFGFIGSDPRKAPSQ